MSGACEIASEGNICERYIWVITPVHHKSCGIECGFQLVEGGVCVNCCVEPGGKAKRIATWLALTKRQAVRTVRFCATRCMSHLPRAWFQRCHLRTGGTERSLVVARKIHGPNNAVPAIFDELTVLMVLWPFLNDLRHCCGATPLNRGSCTLCSTVCV